MHVFVIPFYTNVLLSLKKKFLETTQTEFAGGVLDGYHKLGIMVYVTLLLNNVWCHGSFVYDFGVVS